MNKAEVLAALYNASRPQGMGFLQYDPTPMTTEEAEKWLERCPHFDYLKGRVMKLSLDKDEFDERLYDRDNGQGAAQRVIDNMNNASELNAMHEDGKRDAAIEVLGNMDRTEIRETDGLIHATLGFDRKTKEKVKEVIRDSDNQSN